MGEGKRGGRMRDMALVDEMPVWLEINGKPAVTWMCTPERLEELAVGWMHGEGFIDSVDDLESLEPCATDLGFWAKIAPARLAAVDAEERNRVLASGCGAVSTLLADPSSIPPSPARGEVPPADNLRGMFKRLFQSGERYRDTGGIHAAAMVNNDSILAHAEDIGRHNAVDKVIGEAILSRRRIEGVGLLVTGRISAELAFKAARAGMIFVATPSVPSTLAAKIGRRSGMTLVGRAVSGSPHIHKPDSANTP